MTVYIYDVLFIIFPETYVAHVSATKLSFSTVLDFECGCVKCSLDRIAARRMSRSKRCPHLPRAVRVKSWVIPDNFHGLGKCPRGGFHGHKEPP